MFKTYNTSFIDLISATTIGQKIQFAQDASIVTREAENQVVVMDETEPEYVISIDRLAYTLAFSPYSNHSLADGGKIVFIPRNIAGQTFIIGEDTLEFAQNIVDLYGLTDTVDGEEPVTDSSNRGTNQVAITFVNMAEITTNLSIGSTNSDTFQYVSFQVEEQPEGASAVLYSVEGTINVGSTRTVIITASFDNDGEVTGILFTVL